jgi:UDP-2,3-diacylglucosamine hydrolase
MRAESGRRGRVLPSLSPRRLQTAPARSPRLSSVVLFVSDLHLGRPEAGDADDVRAFSAWLDAHAAAHTLYVVGDLFDAWIEYRHVVPRTSVRLLGALAAWTDAGRRLVVLAGNHDPWHRTFLRDEVGAEVVADGQVALLEGRRVFVHHGDGLLPGGLYRRLRPVLRHPLPVGLYRMLPVDLGVGLARHVSNRMRRRHNPGVATGMREWAHAHVRAGHAEGVVFGHTHRPELHEWAEGIYANPGAWYETRTFIRLDPEGWTLARWSGEGASSLARTSGEGAQKL